MNIFGKGTDTAFHELLEAQAEAAVRAAEAFVTLARDPGHAAEHAAAIKGIEHEGDTLRHQLANKVDSTFVTPLDKEDLNALSSTLDDVLDAIEGSAKCFALYRLNESRPDLAKFAETLVGAVKSTRATVGELRRLKGRDAMKEVFLPVHEAENHGDALYQEALANLYNAPGADPILVLKWREVYERIEGAFDACERVADLVEGVSIKYA